VIAVDTSALMAILLAEAGSDAYAAALEAAPQVLISAGTVAEALIVSGRRNVGEEMADLIEGLGFTVVPVSATGARRVAEAYARWGKGVHPAGLNFGDCFAYAVARDHGCPLLYVGDDFAQTDLPAFNPDN
jgi:ribonuclease VapC